MARRTLLLSAAFGSGHYQAALSVGEACEQLYAGSVTRAVNLESPLLRGTAELYLTLLSRAPELYRRLYHAPVGPRTRRLIRLALVEKVWREVKSFHPDLIVATHPFSAAAAAHLRQTEALAAPLYVVLTDFAPHPLWVHTGVDRYFVAASETARRLQILGVASGLISVTGIPVPFRSGLPGWPEPGA